MSSSLPTKLGPKDLPHLAARSPQKPTSLSKLALARSSLRKPTDHDVKHPTRHTPTSSQSQFAPLGSPRPLGRNSTWATGLRTRSRVDPYPTSRPLRRTQSGVVSFEEQERAAPPSLTTTPEESAVASASHSAPIRSRPVLTGGSAGAVHISHPSSLDRLTDGKYASTGESSGNVMLSCNHRPANSGNEQESVNEEWPRVAPTEHKEPHGELSTYDEDYETTTSLLQEDAGLPSPSQSLGHAVSGGDIGSTTSQISSRSELSPLITRPSSDTGIVSNQESAASSP